MAPAPAWAATAASEAVVSRIRSDTWPSMMWTLRWARGVMELLEAINEQGTTILMVTHDPELATRTQRNVHIIDGQVSDLVRKAPSLVA